MLLLTGYVIIIAFLRTLKIGVGPEFFDGWPLLVGVVLGTQFYHIDQWVVSILHTRGLLSRKRPLTQNILFAYGWIIIALFGITSTVGLFGKGVVMGIGVQIAVLMIRSSTKFSRSLSVPTESGHGLTTCLDSAKRAATSSPRKFVNFAHQRGESLFWPFRLSEVEQKWARRVFWGAFGLLTLLL